ncbi:Os09g0459400 [Oryza sativa Japonica Group]|uniref:Uncharacterized protein n=4 Tax=Oryza TaxID=4527 RepID=A0A8J8YHG4_ORYSJ|nr:hypothetical protein OsJ_29641 [Oryza sativa Japonica Group]BAT08460.1 Os09g0459400 [Oryza sativa Japonica Group]
MPTAARRPPSLSPPTPAAQPPLHPDTGAGASLSSAIDLLAAPSAAAGECGPPAPARLVPAMLARRKPRIDEAMEPYEYEKGWKPGREKFGQELVFKAWQTLVRSQCKPLKRVSLAAGQLRDWPKQPHPTVQ